MPACRRARCSSARSTTSSSWRHCQRRWWPRQPRFTIRFPRCRKLPVPSGNLTQLLKMAIYNGFTHKKWWFSIVMLVYQRVFGRNIMFFLSDFTEATNQFFKTHQGNRAPTCQLCRDRYWFRNVNNLQPSLTTWTFLHISTCIYIYMYANNIYHKPSKTQFLEFSASTGDPTFDVSVPTRAHADQATDRETHRTRAPRSRSVGMTFMCWNGLHIFEMDTYIYIYIWYMIYHDIMIWYYGFWGVL